MILRPNPHTGILPPQKVLVTGSRDWTNREAIHRELSKFPPGTIVVHGAARGADTLADEVAKSLGFEVRPYPVTKQDWEEIGKAAGVLRNSKMLTEEHPDKDGRAFTWCLGFSENLAESRGTKDMVKKTERAGIPTEVFSH